MADEFVLLFLSEKWELAVFPLKALSLVGLLKTLNGLVAPLVNALGKPEITVKYSMICTIVMPAAFIIGSFWGINGVAISWLIMYPLLFTILMSWGLREIGTNLYEFLTNLKDLVMISLIMVFIVMLVKQLILSRYDDLIIFIGTVATGVATYLISTYFINSSLMTEIKIVFSR